MTDRTHPDSGRITGGVVEMLKARIADLEAQLASIGAGGVNGPLIGQPQAMPDLSQLTERGAKAWAGVDAQGLREGFTAADMATAAAQGFRDGVASLAASAGREPVAWVDERVISWLANSRAHSATIGTTLEKGKSSERPMPLYAHPSPPEGMAGWISVDERLPEPDVPVLAHNGKWTGVAAWMSGEYLEPLERWQDEHREFIEMMGPAITRWMPLPLPPTSAEGVEHE